MGATRNHTEPKSTPNDATDSKGLSSGELAAAITVPIVVIILAVSIVLLCFYFKKRRSKVGSYKPNELEVNAGNVDGKITPNSGLWLPPKERLFWKSTYRCTKHSTPSLERLNCEEINCFFFITVSVSICFTFLSAKMHRVCAEG